MRRAFIVNLEIPDDVDLEDVADDVETAVTEWFGDQVVSVHPWDSPQDSLGQALIQQDVNKLD